jgi:hypothetical protein
MRDVLRFFLSAGDQARVDPASVTATDVPPGVLTGAHQALRVDFTITNPAAGAPQLRTLFPGALSYRADPSAPGVLPEPAVTELTPAGFATWQTRGTLCVKVQKGPIETALRNHGPGLEVQPNIAWYSPVLLTEAFMLTTLVSSLKKGNIGSPFVKPTNAEWPKHAVSRFLQGVYTPLLQHGATAPDDDVVVHAMPILFMAANGQVTLTITIARTQPPQDGHADVLDALAPGVPREDPLHPINAVIPARHVYRSVRAHLVDGGAAAPLADLVLKPWPQARRYFPFKITRTWQAVPNFSVLVPSREVIVSTGASSSIVLPVPAHGVVYVPQDSATPEPPPPVLSLRSVLGPLTTFLDGATPNAWRAKSGTAAVPLSTTAPTHVILRRPLREEIFADPEFPAPGENKCTYMSLRRATRAFVDHRLTGGRLTHEARTTKQPTVDLMEAAWNPTAARILRDKKPFPSSSPGLARELEKIWILFFPDTVPAHDIDGTGNFARTRELLGGQMFYALWQTNEEAIAENGTKRNFSNDHVGTGAPGAIVAIGLSSGYLTRPPHAGTSPTPAELNTNVTEMLTLLTPGCVLQFWNTRDGYRLQRNRSGLPQFGHSPIFHSYIPGVGGVPSGIVVVDQFGGDSRCPVQGGRITWGPKNGPVYPHDVWIAAQWDD